MRRIVVLMLLASAVPAAAAARAGGPPYAKFTYERLGVPMRDGVVLSVDIYRPVTDGEQVPVILTLTPYHAVNKALDRNETDLPSGTGALGSYVRQGYALALADVRGTYNSGGCWDYGGIKERQDGYDLVEWLGGVMHDGETPSPAASWSNGRVAMYGASYDGTTANAAAIEQPPHLATIVPVSAISRWWGYAYQQGARATYSGESVDIDPPSDTPADFMLAYGMVPPPDPAGLNDAQQLAMRWNLCDRVEQTLHGYDTEPDYDDFWIERDYLRFAHRVTVPVLVAHGYLDFNVKTWEGIAWYQSLQTPKMLVVGQWPHAFPTYPGWTSLLKRWFERWLYDMPNGVENEDPVRTGANDAVFRSQSSFGDGELRDLALTGPARSFIDDGLLTESEMIRQIHGDRAVRVVVSGSAGLHIQGRPRLRLLADSSATSTHFVAVLCDVGPTGGCAAISRAFLNARYRGGREVGSDLVPGVPTAMDLEFIDKDYKLAPDHHLEVIIASSSTTWVASDEQRARNTIYPASSSLEVPLAL
ncbi:MAG TPA: CocE/NonD family hydrolase [Actinomycetota bacterium]|nr:CocE/NonD family hydrolase [Actinomycetota bacterium]